MKIQANAKINLSLDVTGKRPDGYHTIDSIFAEITLADEIEIEKKEEPGIDLDCSDAGIPKESNLVYKAAKLIMDTAGVEKGVSIRLQKNIPSQAGLGGGSSDAAAVLKGINEIYELGFSSEALRRMGASLGADVPFFIEGKAARARGIGEELSHFSLAGKFYVVIVKPQIGVDTKKAYAAIDTCQIKKHPDAAALEKCLRSGSFEQLPQFVGNVFEETMGEDRSEIEEIKTALCKKGALAAAMSGSGSAVFGLFTDEATALLAGEHLRNIDEMWKVFTAESV